LNNEEIKAVRSGAVRSEKRKGIKDRSNEKQLLRAEFRVEWKNRKAWQV